MSDLMIQDREEKGVARLAERLQEPRPEAKQRSARSFVPMRDQVLVRRCTEFEMSETGMLHIPGEAQEKQLEGVVLKAGRGRFDLAGNFYPCEVQEGDHVLFGRYDGLEIKLNGQEVLILKETQIVGVLR